MKTSTFSLLKIVFLIFCYYVSINSVMSQTFSISPSNTITDTAVCGTTQYQSAIFVSNLTSSDLYLSYTIVSNTLPGDSCWEYQFCDWYQCLPYLPTGTTIPPTPIPANDSASILFDIIPYNNKGEGSFILSIAETNNPSNSKTITWNMSGCLTGTECTSIIFETSNHSRFTIFPNPAQNFINVEIINGYHPNGSIYVYNVMGEKLIKYAGIKNNAVKIDLTNFPAGGYFIKYDDGENTCVNKFFKIK